MTEDKIVQVYNRASKKWQKMYPETMEIIGEKKGEPYVNVPFFEPNVKATKVSMITPEMIEQFSKMSITLRQKAGLFRWLIPKRSWTIWLKEFLYGKKGYGIFHIIDRGRRVKPYVLKLNDVIKMKHGTILVDETVRTFGPYNMSMFFYNINSCNPQTMEAPSATEEGVKKADPKYLEHLLKRREMEFDYENKGKKDMELMKMLLMAACGGIAILIYFVYTMMETSPIPGV